VTAPETISVLAGGWSVRGLDLTRLPGFIIAVNDAAIRAPRVDYIVSMDRLWTEYRWDRLCALPRPTYLRSACVKNIPDWNRWWVRPYVCDHETSEPDTREGFLNGTNSGAVALNLAYQMRPKRINLFGFDMGRCPVTKRKYWYDDLPWTGGKGGSHDYITWARQFEPIARAAKAVGIKIVNASPASMIPSFKKADPRSLLLPERA